MQTKDPVSPMSIDPKLLHILRCPVTKQKLVRATSEEIEQLNKLISEQLLEHVDGSGIEQPLTDALVTENRQIIYQITDGIPVMLEDQSILAQQVENWQ